MNIIILCLIHFYFWSLKQFKYLRITGRIKDPLLSHTFLLIIFNRQRCPTKNKGDAREYRVEEAGPERVILIDPHRWGDIWVRTCSLAKVRLGIALWGRGSTSKKLRQCGIHAWEGRQSESRMSKRPESVNAYRCDQPCYSSVFSIHDVFFSQIWCFLIH